VSRRPLPRPSLRLLAVAAACALGTAVVPASAAPVSAPARPVPVGDPCRDVTVPVPAAVLGAAAIAGGDDLTIFGRFCLPRGKAPQTALLALHGITYTSEYWDSQLEPETYAFTRTMTDAGYAVLAVDRLGYGQSTHPPSSAVTLDVQAEVADALISALRDGAVEGTAFRRVALVGHSYGTATSWRTTALHNNADVVVGTGWGSTIQTAPLARFFTGFYPARLDNKFRDSGYDPGYLTPVPGGRDQDFLYDRSNVDPAVVQYDEDVLRDTVTVGEGFTFYNRYGAIPLGQVPPSSDEVLVPLSDQTKAITKPTFLVNGESELFFCGASQNNCNSSQQLQRSEAQYFSDSACFRAAVTPHAGHNLNLQRNAQDTYSTILTWLNQSLRPVGSAYDEDVARCAAFSGVNGTDGPATYGAFGG
jgi:pimeloyl-ACP methyl ester carboxylesterase